MNTNYGLPSGWTVMQQPKWKPYALQSLIDTRRIAEDEQGVAEQGAERH